MSDSPAVLSAFDAAFMNSPNSWLLALNSRLSLGLLSLAHILSASSLESHAELAQPLIGQIHPGKVDVVGFTHPLRYCRARLRGDPRVLRRLFGNRAR